MGTEMLIVVLSERWISGDFYFFPQCSICLFVCLFVLAMTLFNLYQEEKAIEFSSLWGGEIKAVCLSRGISYIIHKQ